MRFCARLALVAIFIVNSPLAWGRCGAPIVPSKLASIVDDPLQLLNSAPSGGAILAGQIQMLASATDDARRVIVLIIPRANATQKAAIGTGLAQAIASCSNVAGVNGKINMLTRSLTDQTVLAALQHAKVDADSPNALKSSVPNTGASVPSSQPLSVDIPAIPDPFMPMPLPGERYFEKP